MKKRLTILLAILLLTGCTSAVNETDKTSEEPVAEETIPESAELLPEIPETTAAPPQTDESEPIPDEDTIYSDFDEILYEDESYRLAVHDGMIGIFTADGHLYAWLYGVDEAGFYPDESGIMPEEQRSENEYIPAGLRFKFGMEKAPRTNVIAEYVLDENNNWNTYFTFEKAADVNPGWCFFQSDKYGYRTSKNPQANYTPGIFTLYSVYIPQNHDSEVIRVDDDFYIHDGSWYHYSLSDCTKTQVSFIPDDCTYFYSVNTSDGDALGYSVRAGSGLYAFYSLDDEKYLTDFELNDIYPQNSKDYIAVSVPVEPTDENNHYNFKFGILNLNTGEKHGFDRTRGQVAMSVDCSGDTTFFRTSDHFDTLSGYYVYTEDMTLISEETFSLTAVTDDGTLLAIPYLKNDAPKQFRIYSKNGELLKTSREYEKVLFVCRDWIYAVQNGKLCLLDTDENTIVEFTDWSDRMFIHWMLSGYKKESSAQTDAEEPFKYHYYERNEAGEYTEAETDVYPEGLYLLTEDESIDYGVTGRAREYFYSPETGLAGMLAWGEVGGYAKPVLYLYPEEETEVSVSFAHPEILTTVYPTYEESWQMTAEPDGTLTDERGREYYALYWEESGFMPTNFETGFCVPRENAAAFLEEKLGHLGLTNREANEMIMYWLPIMEKSEYSLVFFELTESREKYNHLHITPVPDSLLRIAIHIRPADEFVLMEEQILPAWERHGFAAVEWGGTVHG